MKAALPPLESAEEYWSVHDIVSGKRPIVELIPRRTPGRVTAEDAVQKQIEEHANLILEGPDFGPRLKDWAGGRPHKITPRLLQRMLSRVVLSQTPLVKNAATGAKTEADSGIVFYWDDGLSTAKIEQAEQSNVEALSERQAELLFA